MPFTTTDNDQQFYYETSGDSDPTIVFVPGYMGIWRPVLSRLGGQYRYVIYDTRSCGRSSKPEDSASYSVERHALDLKSLLTALDINKPVILVTHSMGCNIASAYCLSNSAQVRGMVQVGAHYDGKQLSEAGYTVDVFCGKAHIPSEAIGFYMRHNAHALVKFELRDRAKEISVPTLIIQGGNDEISIKKLEVLLNCFLRFIPNVNHFPPNEAPDDVTRVIDGFVNSLPE